MIDGGTTPTRAASGSMRAWSILAAWLAGSTLLIWMFFFAPIFGHGASVMTTFQSGNRSQADFEHWARFESGGGSGGPMIVFVRQPDCPCDRQISGLKRAMTRDAALRRLAVREVTTRPDPARLDSESASQVDAARLRDWVSAAPAVMIIDAGGKVAYAGPLGASALCGDGPAAADLARFIARPETPVRVVPLASGCFCPI